MTFDEALKEIIEIVDPLDPLDADTVIADSDDLDSLALFNIVVYLRKNGYTGSFEDISKCTTLRDIVNLIVK